MNSLNLIQVCTNFKLGINNYGQDVLSVSDKSYSEKKEIEFPQPMTFRTLVGRPTTGLQETRGSLGHITLTGVTPI